MLAKLWINRDQYEARRRLDENGRAVLMTYTHGTCLAIDGDDLQNALADAAALLETEPPRLPEYPPVETVVAMMDLAALCRIPAVQRNPSRWHGHPDTARRMLALADRPEERRPA